MNPYTVVKVEITRITVRPERGDPIHVELDDTDGRGQVTVRCYDQTWSHYWPTPNRGLRTLLAFLAGCDLYYAANKLGGDGWFDLERTQGEARRLVLDARRHHGLEPDRAREIFDDVVDIGSPEAAARWGCELAAAVDGHPGDWMPHELTIDPAFARAYRQAWPVLQELSRVA